MIKFYKNERSVKAVAETIFNCSFMATKCLKNNWLSWLRVISCTEDRHDWESFYYGESCAKSNNRVTKYFGIICNTIIHWWVRSRKRERVIKGRKRERARRGQMEDKGKVRRRGRIRDWRTIKERDWIPGPPSHHPSSWIVVSRCRFWRMSRSPHSFLCEGRSWGGGSTWTLQLVGGVWVGPLFCDVWQQIGFLVRL